MFNGCLTSKYINGEIKLLNKGSVNIYNIRNINSAGRLQNQQLIIELSDTFEIRAQNVSEYAFLRLEILNENGEKVYEDVVGEYGVIAVGN